MMRQFSLLFAFLILAVFVSQLSADPITKMDGIIGQWTLTNNNDGTASLSVTPANSAVSTINDSALGITNFIPTEFSPSIITINTVGEPEIDFNIMKEIGPGGVNEHGDPVTGSVVFDANLNIINAFDLFMDIQGNEVIMSDTSPELDMSAWPGGVGGLTMSFQIANGQPTITDVLAGNQSTTSGSGSFSQSNVPFGVPEPTSIAIWTVLGLLSVAGALKLRRKK